MTENLNTTVEIEISDTDFIALARGAHERDITLNQYINCILREFLNKEDWVRG